MDETQPQQGEPAPAPTLPPVDVPPVDAAGDKAQPQGEVCGARFGSDTCSLPRGHKEGPNPVPHSFPAMAERRRAANANRKAPGAAQAATKATPTVGPVPSAPPVEVPSKAAAAAVVVATLRDPVKMADGYCAALRTLADAAELRIEPKIWDALMEFVRPAAVGVASRISPGGMSPSAETAVALAPLVGICGYKLYTVYKRKQLPAPAPVQASPPRQEPTRPKAPEPPMPPEPPAPPPAPRSPANGRVQAAEPAIP